MDLECKRILAVKYVRHHSRKDYRLVKYRKLYRKRPLEEKECDTIIRIGKKYSHLEADKINESFVSIFQLVTWDEVLALVEDRSAKYVVESCY